jgi:hypothetical protein
MEHTEEDHPCARPSCRLIREPTLIRFKGGKAYRHFGYDAAEDCPKALVQRQGCLSLYYLRTSCNESARFRL